MRVQENLRNGVLFSVPNLFYSIPPEKIRKPYGFLKFSGGRERVHWE